MQSELEMTLGSKGKKIYINKNKKQEAHRSSHLKYMFNFIRRIRAKTFRSLILLIIAVPKGNQMSTGLLCVQKWTNT